MDLKDQYSPAFLLALGTAIQRRLPDFDVTAFQAIAGTTDWANLKLMERSDRIVRALHTQLPADFAAAAAILRQVGPEFKGLTATCLPNYVAKYGLDDWETSMATLAVLTQYSSAEFAIRPFLQRFPVETARQMLKWSLATNVDLRRLASEGIRPRLPWGVRLKAYVLDPTPIWPILTNLLADDQVYVQKSVANNLNDISKDHPDEVVAFAVQHWGQETSSDWILTRGLRTLFKQGDARVLKLLGYDPQAAQQLTNLTLTATPTQVSIGETNQFDYQLTNSQTVAIPLYLGYRVHYVRQNKATSYKDFYIKRLIIKGGQTVTGKFKVNWKQLSTRKLYPGDHPVELLVNTQAVNQVNIGLQE